MDSKLRLEVRERAAHQCEYCKLQEKHEFFAFHLEHIISRQHGGANDLANLAWACHHCNLHKGPNLSGIDPDTDQLTRLFHPRNDAWDTHCYFEGVWINGLTDVGRTTYLGLADEF